VLILCGLVLWQLLACVVCYKWEIAENLCKFLIILSQHFDVYCAPMLQILSESRMSLCQNIMAAAVTICWIRGNSGHVIHRGWHIVAAHQICKSWSASAVFPLFHSVIVADYVRLKFSFCIWSEFSCCTFFGLGLVRLNVEPNTYCTWHCLDHCVWMLLVHWKWGECCLNE